MAGPILTRRPNDRDWRHLTDEQWRASASICSEDRPDDQHPPYGFNPPDKPGESLRILLYDLAGRVINGVVIKADGTVQWARPPEVDTRVAGR